VNEFGGKPGVETRPASTGPAATATSAASAGTLTDRQIDDIVLAAIKANPLDTGGARIKPLDPPKITPIASNNPHLGGTVAIPSPLKRHCFRCVLLGYGMAAPFRRYACVTSDGNLVIPFASDKNFAQILAAEDTSKWTDQDFLDAARLYVHLMWVANEDGWVLLNKPEDFVNITFNMPKAGTPQDEKRREDAKKVVAPTVTRREGTAAVRFFVWRCIGGNLHEWTFEFGKEFKASFKEVARWGGGGYD
jgi:hypothetical protein